MAQVLFCDIDPFSFVEATHRPYLYGGHPQGGGMSFMRELSKDLEHARHYMPGDSPKWLDWKVFGRSEQLIVRQSQPLSSIHMGLILDASPSMFWPTKEVSPPGTSIITKWESSLRVACALMYMHLHRQDQVHGYVFYKNAFMPLEISSKDQLLAFYQASHQSGFTREGWDHMLQASAFVSDLHPPLAPLAHPLVYFISDLVELDPERLTSLILSKHMFMLHILSDQELHGDWIHEHAFYSGSSSKGPNKHMGLDLKKQYQPSLDMWLKKTQNFFNLQGNCHYAMFTESSTFDSAWMFLNQRHVF